MFSRSPSALPAHTPGAYGTSRATHLCVSLVVDSASYFAGAARKPLVVSPHVFLTDCRGLGVLLPPLGRTGPVVRATGKRGYDDDAQVCYRVPHILPVGIQ